MVEYLSEMTDIITDDGGTLDKYIGDAIDAMYGAPLSLDNHAYVAVGSTIRMQKKQIELQEKWKSEGRKELIQNMRTRIGLNTGTAVVGNMGSVRRFNYTMMGDSVNLGARCESGAKSYGVYTMITDRTKTAAVSAKDDVIYRYLDQIVVKGKTKPVKVHEVIGFKHETSPETLDCLELYEQGLNAYLKSRWSEAILKFEKASALELFQPDKKTGVVTNPSRVMIDRCRIYQVSPPPLSWDGVFQMTSK
jgi:adenylate cyclase